MAATYKSDADATPATGTSIAYTSFNSTGTNPVAMLLIALASDTVTVSSVVCSAGLTSGTPSEIGTRRSTIGGSGVGPKTYLSIWAIPAPSGTGTLTATLSGSVDWQSNLILLEGADQTTPCPTGAGNVGGADGSTPNPLSVTLGNLASGDIGVGIGAQNSSGDAPTFGQMQTFNNNTTNINAAAGYRSGAGAVTVTWGGADFSDTLLVVRVVAASGGDGDTQEWRSRSEFQRSQRIIQTAY
jgi:hypothetical protein